MADVDDRWFRAEKDSETGKERKVRTSRHGQGKRYRARWRDATGRQRGKCFDRKRDAQFWLSQVETDLSRGTYVDPSAGKVRLEEYGHQWLASQTFDESTREAVELRLRLHVYPTLGGYELRAVQPAVVQAWARRMDKSLAASTTRVVFANLSAIFKAAVDNGLIGTNPCRAGSVRRPTPDRRKVVPWPAERVEAVRAALPLRFREVVIPACGAGLRQGEVFGLSLEDIDKTRGVIHVRHQVKIVGSRLVFAPPKRGKTRVVPLSATVERCIDEHTTRYPPVAVTLPWKIPDGQPTTLRLLFTTREKGALNRNYVNRLVWKPALDAVGVPTTRENGMHALRHFFASVVLDGGASVRDLADWLGHEDPGFTLRVYAHLMPNSAEKLRGAVDHALQRVRRDGPNDDVT